MYAYAIRRLLVSIPVLFVSSLVIFWFVSLSGDPVALKYLGRNPPIPQTTINLEYERLHLREGFFSQYWHWLWGLLHGDFGPSINSSTDIGHELYTRSWITLRLVFFAMLIAMILAVVTGVLSAVRQYSKLDYVFTFLGFLFLAMPTFWVAVLLKQGGIALNQASGTTTFYTIGEKSPIPPATTGGMIMDVAGHMILPTIALALITYAAWSRFQRAAMLEVLNSDYLRLARAKGLRPGKVLTRHALRTALIPMTTASAITIAAVLGGAVITETVFEWRGLGRFLVEAVATRDRYSTMGWLVLAGVMVIVGNLVADLLYAVLDPRIRYE